MTLGQIVKEYRFKNKLTQGQFAKKVGVGHATVSRIEKGLDTAPKTAKRISRVVGVKLKPNAAKTKTQTKTPDENLAHIENELNLNRAITAVIGAWSFERKQDFLKGCLGF